MVNPAYPQLATGAMAVMTAQLYGQVFQEDDKIAEDNTPNFSFSSKEIVISDSSSSSSSLPHPPFSLRTQ